MHIYVHSHILPSWIVVIPLQPYASLFEGQHLPRGLRQPAAFCPSKGLGAIRLTGDSCSSANSAGAVDGFLEGYQLDTHTHTSTLLPNGALGIS